MISGLQRETVEHYLTVLERLFLLRHLPAWHHNTAKRLIKSPKTHLLDSGLGAALADPTSSDWLERRDRMGHLLESFVVQQLIAQAAWTDAELRFWHYHDDTGAEDLGHQSQGRHLVDSPGRARACTVGGPLWEGFPAWYFALCWPGHHVIGRQTHARCAPERTVDAINA